MKKILRLAATSLLALGTVASAQAGNYLCDYAISDGRQGTLPVTATDQSDALTQAFARLYDLYGSHLGYRVQCHPQT